MSGIVAAAAYVPRWRLDRAAAGIGRGTRSVASFDEDPTSMAVEAARAIVRGDAASALDRVVFATTSPPYADRTNATAIHGALDLDPSVGAYDAVGSVRSTVGALRGALDAAATGRTTLLVAGDVRVGLPGSGDERDGGDGAAALVVGPAADTRAELVGSASVTAEFLDRWRIPGELTSRVWEERFGETEYVPLAEAALGEALKSAGVAVGDVDHLVVTGLHARAVGAARKAAGARPEAVVDDLSAVLGCTGAAHPLLLLTDVLERAEPGQLVALLVLADGADCLVFRTGAAGRTSGLGAPGGRAAHRPPRCRTPTSSCGAPCCAVRRPAGPIRTGPRRRPRAGTPAWKFGLVGTRCRDCGTRHLPPERVCLRCRSKDHMEREPLAELQGTISTFAVDHLALTVAPPVIAAVVDLDGGGRIQCELADCHRRGRAPSATASR